jgi:hypothetical protein
LNVYGQQVPGDLVNNSAPTINKGKRRADEFGSGSGSGKRRTSGSHFCPRHGGSRSNHDDKDCYSASKKPTSFAAGPLSSNSTMSSRSGSATSSGPRSITFLGNTNAPFRANGNNPCRYCKKPWFRGHSCAEYHQAMRASNGPSVLAIRANNGTNTSASEEEDKKVKEAMEDLNYDCKFDDDESQNTRSTFQLMTPMYIEGIRFVARIDTGSDTSCFNKKQLNKDFSDVHIVVFAQ